MKPARLPRTAFALALVAGLFACVGARAQQPWEPAAVRDAQAREHARELERLVSSAHGVKSVTVQVILPDPLAQPLDAQPSPPVVRMRVAAPEKDWETLRQELPKLALDLFPGAPDPQLSLNLSAPAAAPKPRWTSVGPFRVSPGSAGPLRAALALLLSSCFGLALLLVRYARGRLQRSNGVDPTG